jgi:quercetin dioxygenase-like cupin family protein
MAHTFKDKSFNPLMVFAPYKKENAGGEIEMSTHSGHEFNLIISGRLRIIINGHTEILNEGDSVFYDALNPHGMAAIDESGCKFLAVLSNM